jgi:acyl dehydratase
MAITDLEGKTYVGTSTVEAGHVAAFVEVTGDVADRWTEVAPPSYAAALLFSVAPSFLWDDAAGDYSNILIHADQAFVFEEPIRVGVPMTTEAVVERIRIRKNVAWVTFSATMSDNAGVVMTSRSTFIMSDEAPPADAEEQPEPAPLERARSQVTGSAEHVHKSASRQDLVRYAGVSGDFNPLHWDHDAARKAGLPRIVAHGLLSASWALAEAATLGAGDMPLLQAKLRFKQPLLAGDQALVTATQDGGNVSVEVTSGSETVVQASAVVTL